ncbi:hypothetical protein F5Y16DRAFT_400724 [Xylariaceae sp. FL0255]|nr:hypothetical protein F5Y16DRAFT_400724 [Xylariaceae sp. FL0255]
MPRASQSQKIARKLGLDWSPAKRATYLKSVKVVDIKRLPEPYPTDNFYMAGTPTAREQWAGYWHGKPLKDPRYNKGLRREIRTLEKEKLQYIIPQDESVIFRDADTKALVMVVLRDFIPSEPLRQTIIDVCKEIIRNRRDDRREDPGQLVHFGYTCGSRHDRQIQMAASCVRLNTAVKQQNEIRVNEKAQGMAGIVWNLMKSKLPEEITSDYNDMIDDYDFPRMDMGRDDEVFTFQVEGEDITFEGLELPPPSGLSAINYARHTHKETNGNNWIIACTANAPDDPEKGGNFYNASYGIMMMPASNTVSAWHPTDHHGTTLYEMMEGPERRAGYEIRTDGGFNTGLVFEISKAFKSARVNSAWLDRRREARGLKKPLLRSQSRQAAQTSFAYKALTMSAVAAPVYSKASWKKYDISSIVEEAAQQAVLSKGSSEFMPLALTLARTLGTEENEVSRFQKSIFVPAASPEQDRAQERKDTVVQHERIVSSPHCSLPANSPSDDRN